MRERKRASSSGQGTATNEVNNLYAVVVVKYRSLPVAATNYFAVEFDGDSGWLETKSRYQRVDG